MKDNKFAHINEGDWVRVEYEGKWEGERFVRGVDPDDLRDWIAYVPPFATVTVPRPAEPPVGSVVLNRYGAAFQRFSTCWVAVGMDDDLTWEDVCALGPLRVIYTPEDGAK